MTHFKYASLLNILSKDVIELDKTLVSDIRQHEDNTQEAYDHYFQDFLSKKISNGH